VTRTLNIHGFHPHAASLGTLSFYGTDAMAIQKLVGADAALGQALDAELPYVAAEVVWAAREEMARSVEDVLARRTRALFLNARAAIRMAPRVAALLARELGQDEKWQCDQLEEFNRTAAGYLVRT
jgi:glycerol-3-phosphate dehydrogenase